MAIWLYKKHPPHNLGGENYPHFQNEAQKKTWISVHLINDSQKINLNLTRISFDQAVVNLNLKNLSIRADQISGLRSSEDNLFFTFWWVVGWNAGANDEVVSLNLTLDYWLTYWPLKFNSLCYVKIARRHINRFFYLKEPYEQVKLLLNKRAFHVPEESVPPNIFPTKLESKPVIKYFLELKLLLMIGIVFCGIGGADDYDKNYYPKTGVNNPGNQNGWLIFARADNLDINDWLSFPGITQTFYFFINIDDLHKVKNTESFTKYPQTNDYRGIYSIKKNDTLDFDNKLNVIWFDEIGDGAGGYQYFVFRLAQMVYLSYQFKPYSQKSLLIERDILIIDQNYKIKFDLGVERPQCQLFSLKSFFKNRTLKLNTLKTHWINQFKRRAQNIYFTTLNIFNQYSNHHSKKNNHFFDIEIDTKKIYDPTKFNKNELWDEYRDLKIIMNQNFYLCFQNKSQEFKFWWFSLYKNFTPRYYFYWTITLQNSYLNLEPTKESNIFVKNKKYNFVFANETKLNNYTDQSLEFFQQQGISFQQGIDQAKYQIDWLKRYQSFQDTSFKYRQITGVIKGVLGDIAGAAATVAGAKTGRISGGQASGLAFGLAGDIADRAVNTVFNFQEFNLNQELKRKNALYALKSLQARQADIFNQPTTTHSVDSVEFNYWLISKKCMPFLITLAPANFDWKAQALIYHKNGYANDQNETIDFNKSTRRCWNFWQIINIEQAIVKDKLNSMVINYFNKLFNDGIRLWNVFYEEVEFNNYFLENWEQDVLKNEN